VTGVHEKQNLIWVTNTRAHNLKYPLPYIPFLRKNIFLWGAGICQSIYE
jgi:hypothetical protein